MQQKRKKKKKKEEERETVHTTRQQTTKCVCQPPRKRVENFEQPKFRALAAHKFATAARRFKVNKKNWKGGDKTGVFSSPRTNVV